MMLPYFRKLTMTVWRLVHSSLWVRDVAYADPGRARGRLRGTLGESMPFVNLQI